MRFDEADTDLLKAWTIAKLEHVSDADADVLADYVLALVTTEEAEPVAKANCIENLRDFLGDKAESFVHELFTALATRAYDPSKPAPRPSRPTYQPLRRASIDPIAENFNVGRKRGYQDRARGEDPPNPASAGRPAKHARRNGAARSGRGSSKNGYPQPPIPPPGMPPYDPTNPMASFMAMCAAMGMMPPGMPTPPSQGQYATGTRCNDFDTKGFCTRGAQCPYKHGNETYVVPEEYADFDTSDEIYYGRLPSGGGSLNLDRAENLSKSPASKGDIRRGRRAEFSMQGANQDHSLKTIIVVEQIPKNKFDEQTIRDFFAEYGTIEAVKLMPYKRLATIQYDSYEAAKAAYNSPKAVFANRFVKVYWYKSPHSHPTSAAQGNEYDTEMHHNEPEIDMEDFRRRQEEAQQRHEEKQKLLEEVRKNRQDIDAKLEELDAKKRQLADELARKQGKPVESERTRQMREQLAKLEAEARTLGIDPDAVSISPEWPAPSYDVRSRGGYRGRGRGRRSYRSSWAAATKGGAVKRLDNRSKTVLLVFKEGSYEGHQESLQSWLLFTAAEHASLTRHPERQDAALIKFEERYQGEIFMDSTVKTDFPLHGQIELSWYAGPPVGTGSHDVEMKREDAAPYAEVQHDDDEVSRAEECDGYDVAHEDDRWG